MNLLMKFKAILLRLSLITRYQNKLFFIFQNVKIFILNCIITLGKEQFVDKNIQN